VGDRGKDGGEGDGNGKDGGDESGGGGDKIVLEWFEACS
jgi:hypothetical protein